MHHAIARAAIVTGIGVTALTGPAAHADELDIEAAGPAGPVTVAGGCEAADRRVRITGAARGTGEVVDGWFTVRARVVRERAGEHRIEARCESSGLTQEGTVRLAERTGGPANDTAGPAGPAGGTRGTGGSDGADEAGGTSDTNGAGGASDADGASRADGAGDSGGSGVVRARDGGPVPRGWAETGGGGAHEPGPPWGPAGTVLIAAAAGVGAAALVRSRAAGGRR